MPLRTLLLRVWWWPTQHTILLVTCPAHRPTVKAFTTFKTGTTYHLIVGADPELEWVAVGAEVEGSAVEGGLDLGEVGGFGGAGD